MVGNLRCYNSDIELSLKYLWYLHKTILYLSCLRKKNSGGALRGCNADQISTPSSSFFFFFFPSNGLLDCFSKWFGENMKVTSKTKCWDWKALEGRGKGSRSLGDRCACTSTQHREITYILQWRKPVEAPSVFLHGTTPAPVPPQKSEVIINLSWASLLCHVQVHNGHFIKQERLTHFRKAGENHIITSGLQRIQSFQSFWAGKGL